MIDPVLIQQGKFRWSHPQSLKKALQELLLAHRQANILQTWAFYRATVLQEVQEDSCVIAVSLLLLLTAPKEKQGVSGDLAPATCPLWQVITILCFTSPTHKIRIRNSPLNTFSLFDGSFYNYIIIAGYYISCIILWWSVQMSNLSILQTNWDIEMLAE